MTAHSEALADVGARLTAGREALLAALGRLGERDFALEIAPGEPVIAALAALAPAERASVAAARSEAGLPPRPLAASPGPRARPTPPQVVHDLAGARHETLRLLAELAGAPTTPTAELEALGALRAAAARELALAERIAALAPGGGASAPGSDTGA